MESGRIKEVPHEEYKDPFAGLTIAEIKAQDKPNTGTLTEARLDDERDFLHVGYEGDDAWGNAAGISAERCPGGVLPEWLVEAAKKDELVGKSITFYSRGSQFHGVDIDGREVFYRTPMERDADRAVWLAEHDRENREEYAERKEQRDRDYEALPEPLKNRIARFRAADPAFRVESEGYELFCCVEAAKFVERARDAAAHGANRVAVEKFFAQPERKDGEKVWDGEHPEDPALAWLLWAWAVGSEGPDYDHDRQRELLDYSRDHSGNTFGGAMAMAGAILRGEEV